MRKRKYLYRLAMSLLLIVLLPMVIFIISFSKYSYEKVRAANEEYTAALMDYYMLRLDQMIIDLEEHAALICADSKKSSSIFWEKDAGNEYWYYQAIAEIKDKYSVKGASDFGIYYYEEDCVITADGKLSSDGYFRKFDIRSPEQEENLKDFFAAEKYKEFTLCVGGTQAQEPGRNRMWIGFYTTLGRRRDRVMLFYQYTENDIENFFESAYIESGLECSLWDEQNGFSFFFGNYSETGYVETVRSMLKEPDALKAQKRFLIKESRYQPIVLVGYLNENALGNVTLTFLDHMLIAVSAVLAIVLAGYILILYIAYKPVFHLTTKLKHTEGNEFETIGKALDERRAKIEEQEILLDMLLDNLLYRAPISNGKMKQLGVDAAEYYTVFLLDGRVLPDAEAKKVIYEAEQKYCKKLFVTDLEGEDRTVFVAFLKNGQEASLEEWLSKQYEKEIREGNSFVRGRVVADIKDIWKCLKDCEKELSVSESTEPAEDEENKNGPSRERKRARLREDILKYVEEHYRDIDLNQVLMADHFNISTYTLSRIFRNDVGVRFVTYVNAKRVEYAKELLLTTKESVHDIAVKSGFDNDNHFFKVFKANTGMSPTTFREL